MKASGIKEPVLDIFCIAASYGILFLLPQQVGFLFYLLFGISAFLFCVGFFRLGFAFDAPADPKGELSAGLLCAVAGLVINAAGLYGIWKDQGSGRSIMIATLLLIEALVLYAMAGSGFKTPEGPAAWAGSVHHSRSSRSSFSPMPKAFRKNRIP